MGLRQLIERHTEKRNYLIEKKSEEWLDRFYPQRFRLIYRNGQKSG